MLRHKALIQCARIAFGFSGIYDEDEAARIVETSAASSTPSIENNNSTSALPQGGGVIINMNNVSQEQEKIPVALLKQIEVRAKQQGIKVPEFTSKEEAQSFLNNLLQKKKEESSEPEDETEKDETEKEVVNETEEEIELW